MSEYSSFSPYYQTSLINGYLDIMTFRDVPIQSDDILFEIISMYEFRPDLLAYDLYQESKLWWVFAVRNKDILKDPIYDMTIGTKIYLPKLSVIKKVLGV
jgi:hypothetical protein